MNFNPYMKPASIETRTKNIDIAKKHFMKEIQWIKDNEEAIIMYKHKFLQEMYVILTSGNRRFTEKMALATRKSIKNCMKNPNYNILVKTEAEEKIKPILEKINIVLIQAEDREHNGIRFINSIKDYVSKNYRITTKQMESLNKIYKELNG